MIRAAIIGLATLAAVPAAAQQASAPTEAPEEPRFCPTRPSLGGSSCTTAPGYVQAEASFLDWQRDDSAKSRDDRIVAADLLSRFGLGPTTELQVGWTAFGHDRERDKATGAIDRTDGVGDVTLGIRQRFVGSNGGTFTVGVQPFVSLPVGRTPIGAGDWGAGASVPVQYAVSRTIGLTLTGEADAAVNQSGSGRHLAYDGIGTLRYSLTKAVLLYAEVEAARDDDPSGGTTQVLVAPSVAWRPRKRLQFDAQAIVGVNRAAPGIRLVFGGAVLF